MNVSLNPSLEVMDHFRARLLSFLGGRLNRHWLVEAGGERLILRRWSQAWESIAYEIEVVRKMADRGWPVAPVVGYPVRCEDHFWSLAPLLPGEPRATDDPRIEQRARGRLLAQFHQSIATLPNPEQRMGWRRCEAILADTTLDALLSANETNPTVEQDAIRIIRWHLDRARDRIAGIDLAGRRSIIVHGDFTNWNLLYLDDRLSGILDFELAHADHRIGDFALSWRGKYDDVIYGYNEVASLDPIEWQCLTPMWWAFLIEQACGHLRDGTWDDGWILRKLLERSPLMGPDAIPYC